MHHLSNISNNIISNIIPLPLLPVIYHRIVKELFKWNDDTVKSVDAKDNTPLHLACTSGSLEVVKFIIENRAADLNVR